MFNKMPCAKVAHVDMETWTKPAMGETRLGSAAPCLVEVVLVGSAMRSGV
jgi:uncharacterized protein (UPF0261 family)